MANYLDKKTGGKVRVGPDYQAEIPWVVEANRRAFFLWFRGKPELPHWVPNDDELTADDIDEFISLAKNKYNYTEEQALGFLFWHKYDTDNAMEDMAQFCPRDESWTEEDEVYFQESIRREKKNLLKISQMMGKSMNTVLFHYYSTKIPSNRKIRRSLVQVKQEVPDLDADEFNATLARIKKEDVSESDANADEMTKTLAKIKVEVVDEEEEDDDTYFLRNRRIYKKEPF